jgi:ElaB/YqjD/DUF883 family membrane-anchored ribosome-binding protein
MNAIAESKDPSRQKLATDLKTVVTDAEDYLRASVGQAGQGYAAARSNLEQSLAAAKAQIADAQRAIGEKTRAAARATDSYVHDRPWESIALGASVGLLLGLLARRS